MRLAVPHKRLLQQGSWRLAPSSLPTAAPLRPPPCQVTGPALTLAGFPAWAVRCAEIYGAGPLKALGPEGLQAALRRFCTTKQRFGK